LDVSSLQPATQYDLRWRREDWQSILNVQQHQARVSSIEHGEARSLSLSRRWPGVLSRQPVALTSRDVPGRPPDHLDDRIERAYLGIISRFDLAIVSLAISGQ
jgi:hypothetical protein